VQVYAQHHAGVLETLTKVIDVTRTNEEWGTCRDNAVAALGKILVFHEALSTGELGMKLGTLWLDNLPLVHDDVEAGVQHEFLHQFLVQNDMRVLGENRGNLGKTAEVFVRVISRGTELLKDDHVAPFQAFFFKQLLPVLQEQGFKLEHAMHSLAPKDQQQFAMVAAANGAGA
jgi:hypothetical protein